MQTWHSRQLHIKVAWQTTGVTRIRSELKPAHSVLKLKKNRQVEFHHFFSRKSSKIDRKYPQNVLPTILEYVIKFWCYLAWFEGHTIADWPWSCLRVENWDFWPQGVQKIGYKRVKVRNRIGTIQKTTKSLRDNFWIINKSIFDRFWVIFLKKVGEILLDGFFQF